MHVYSGNKRGPKLRYDGTNQAFHIYYHASCSWKLIFNNLCSSLISSFFSVVDQTSEEGRLCLHGTVRPGIQIWISDLLKLVLHIYSLGFSPFSRISFFFFKYFVASKPIVHDNKVMPNIWAEKLSPLILLVFFPSLFPTSKITINSR